MTATVPAEPGFESHRAHLTRLAYRMLGSVADAEDVVQDTWLRWRRAEGAAIDDPRAWLVTVTTRLCLDLLGSARRRREGYVGPWLPEPLVEELGYTVPPPEGNAHDVSYALMLTLERLSPPERAAFILHDVFDVAFEEVADTLGRTAASCRQLARRARERIEADRPRYDVSDAESRALASAFFAASREGDIAALQDLLARASTFHSDGGGRVSAALNVIHGRERIVRLLAGLARKGLSDGPLWQRAVTIDRLPGLVTREADGTLQAIALGIVEGQVEAIFVIRNPEKLRHLEGFAAAQPQ